MVFFFPWFIDAKKPARASIPCPLPDSTHASLSFGISSVRPALFSTTPQKPAALSRPCLAEHRHRLFVCFGRGKPDGFSLPRRSHLGLRVSGVSVGSGFSQEIQKYPKTEVLQDVTPTPPSTFPYLQQALKPSCKSPQSPRKAHQHPPPSYTPGSA